MTPLMWTYKTQIYVCSNIMAMAVKIEVENRMANSMPPVLVLCIDQIDL